MSVKYSREDATTQEPPSDIVTQKWFKQGRTSDLGGNQGLSCFVVLCEKLSNTNVTFLVDPLFLIESCLRGAYATITFSHLQESQKTHTWSEVRLYTLLGT